MQFNVHQPSVSLVIHLYHPLILVILAVTTLSDRVDAFPCKGQNMSITIDSHPSHDSRAFPHICHDSQFHDKNESIPYHPFIFSREQIFGNTTSRILVSSMERTFNQTTTSNYSWPQIGPIRQALHCMVLNEEAGSPHSPQHEKNAPYTSQSECINLVFSNRSFTSALNPWQGVMLTMVAAEMGALSALDRLLLICSDLFGSSFAFNLWKKAMFQAGMNDQEHVLEAWNVSLPASDDNNETDNPNPGSSSKRMTNKGMTWLKWKSTTGTDDSAPPTTSSVIPTLTSTTTSLPFPQRVLFSPIPSQHQKPISIQLTRIQRPMSMHVTWQKINDDIQAVLDDSISHSPQQPTPTSYDSDQGKSQNDIISRLIKLLESGEYMMDDLFPQIVALSLQAAITNPESPLPRFLLENGLPLDPEFVFHTLSTFVPSPITRFGSLSLSEQSRYQRAYILILSQLWRQPQHVLYDWFPHRFLNLFVVDTLFHLKGTDANDPGLFERLITVCPPQMISAYTPILQDNGLTPETIERVMFGTIANM